LNTGNYKKSLTETSNVQQYCQNSLKMNITTRALPTNRSYYIRFLMACYLLQPFSIY